MNARVSPQDTPIPLGDDPRDLPGTDIAIEAHGLVKRFGKTNALDGVDLIARRGHGPRPPRAERRGQDHRRPHSRHAHPPGRRRRQGARVRRQRDAHQVRQLIGLTGQYASVDEMLSGFNNLVMIGRLLGIPRKQAKARGRAAGAVRPGRGRPPARQDLTLGTGQMLSQDIETGVFDRFRSLPIARWAPLAGAVLGDVVRYALSVAVTLAFGMLLGFRIQTSLLAAAAGCLLVLVFALGMCWFSALLGLIAGSARSVQWIGSLIYFPLTFGSNVLVPTGKLPGWLQAFVKGNPMTFLTEAERGLLIGGPVAVPAIRALLWSLGLVVVFAPIAVEVYRRRA